MKLSHLAHRAALCSVAAGSLFAQNTAWAQETLSAPQVPAATVPAASVAQKTVTLSFFAPTAQKVVVELLPGGPQPMQKSDDGTWKLTTGPLAPEIYEYRFLVDDKQRLPDPQNAWRKGGSSLLVVPGPPNTPALWEIQNVPHGSVTRAFYTSSTLGNISRRVHLYTPPGYNAREKKIPRVFPAARVGRRRFKLGGGFAGQRHFRQSAGPKAYQADDCGYADGPCPDRNG